MNFLLVEDNQYKCEKIHALLKESFPDSYIVVTHSYSSGIKSLTQNDFDYAILDMSLPTFDRVPGKPAGEARTFGGMDIAKQIKRKKLEVKFVFLSQYDSFAENNINYSLETLKIQAQENFPNNFIGFVYYDNSSLVWKTEVLNLLKTK